MIKQKITNKQHVTGPGTCNSMTNLSLSIHISGVTKRADIYL